MPWIAARVFLVFVGALAGPGFARAYTESASLFGLLGRFLVFFLLGAILVLILSLSLAAGRRSGAGWQRPSWRVRPFFGEPLQFAHAAAWYAIGAGVSAALIALVRPGCGLQGATMVGGVGAGMLAATHIVVFAFPRHFVER